MVELTLKDIEFFKTEGYLVKRNVLDPELMNGHGQDFGKARPKDVDVMTLNLDRPLYL